MAENRNKSPKKQNENGFSGKKLIIPIVGIVLILAVGIIIGVVIGKNSGKDSNKNDSAVMENNGTTPVEQNKKDGIESSDIREENPDIKNEEKQDSNDKTEINEENRTESEESEKKDG